MSVDLKERLAEKSDFCVMEVLIAQELCESRGGRPGLSVLTGECSVHQTVTCLFGVVLIDDCLYIAILRSRADSLRSHVILPE